VTNDLFGDPELFVDGGHTHYLLLIHIHVHLHTHTHYTYTSTSNSDLCFHLLNMSIFSERKVKFSDGCGDTSVEKGSVHKRKFSDSIEKSSKRETRKQHKSKGSGRRDTSIEQSLESPSSHGMKLRGT